MSLRARAACWSVWVLTGCAAGSSALQPSAATLSPELAYAARLAPDYAARVSVAHQHLAAERTPAGRADQRARIELLTWAAVAEAQRIALSRAVSAYEARIAAASAQRAELARAQREWIEQRERASAAQRAQTEAEWVFTVLQRAAAPTAVERERIVAFLLRRAEAALATARVLGADEPTIAAAELQLTAAKSRRPAERLEHAHAALSSAYGVLGQARARAPQPSAGESADLRERARECGFELQDGPDGPSVAVIPQLGQSALLRRRFGLLAQLLPAFPHGPIVLACEPDASAAGDCAYAAALAPAERARVQRKNRPADWPRDAVRLALPAYASPSR